MRTPISKKLRFEVFKRDGFVCVYCGAHPSETVVLEADHVQPVADGGTNDIDNLVTACFDCNRGKGAGLLSDVPQSFQDKAEQAREREGQIRAYHEIMEDRKRRRDEESWAVADVWMRRFGDETIKRTDLASIRSFIDRLGFHEVREAMELAADKIPTQDRCFSYFCGICWSKIKEGKR